MTKQLITTTRRKKGADIVAAFRASGKTRTEFCREAGIKVATFDYYHHRVRAEERARLVSVEVVADSSIAGSASVRTAAVWLRNGRRLELSWHGDESSLGRMVRLLERE
jgi:hypothetical protein